MQRVEDRATVAWTARPPDGDAAQCVARSQACIALIGRSGLIEVLSRRLTRDLGFDDPGDLRGLQITSLWHPSDRAAVSRAFAAALRGCSQAADVDLGYVGAGRRAPARITFSKGPGAVLMTLDRPPAA